MFDIWCHDNRDVYYTDGNAVWVFYAYATLLTASDWIVPGTLDLS